MTPKEIMRKFGLSCAASLLIVGCSIPRAPDTAKFYEQEMIAASTCLEMVTSLPLNERFRLDPTNGRSAFTKAAYCYSGQLKSIVTLMNYPHAALAYNYADYVVRLTEARDRGMITTPAALESHKQTTALFKQSIANADAQIEAAARRELANRIAVFAQAMSAIAIEQDRQRMANRPVVCSYTGIYAINGFVCQ